MVNSKERLIQIILVISGCLIKHFTVDVDVDEQNAFLCYVNGAYFSIQLPALVGLVTKITCLRINCDKSFSTSFNLHQHLHCPNKYFKFFRDV